MNKFESNDKIRWSSDQITCLKYFRDKCFDTQEKSVPHNKSSKNTQTGNTIKTKGLGLMCVGSG